jgi:hypothetical protein
VGLIRDWASVLSEVGDHQALVASLRLSPHHAMFKVRLVWGLGLGLTVVGGEGTA